MPNPDGFNQFSGFGQDLPYGQGQVNQELSRAQPIPSAPGMDSPRKAKDRAARPQALVQAQPVAPPAGPAPGQVAYPAMLAQAWGEIAKIPGVSPLVQQYALEAQQSG